MEEAKWMYEVETFHSSAVARDDNGDEMVEFDNPDVIEDPDDPQPKEKIPLYERAARVKGLLIEKICNVLCYLRGIENESIRHGPIALEAEYGEGEEEWDTEKSVTPVYDIPFIAKYRQEYWKPELHYNDLWKILDTDGRWSALQKRKTQLLEKFKQVDDMVGLLSLVDLNLVRPLRWCVRMVCTAQLRIRL